MATENQTNKQITGPLGLAPQTYRMIVCEQKQKTKIKQNKNKQKQTNKQTHQQTKTNKQTNNKQTNKQKHINTFKIEPKKQQSGCHDVKMEILGD